MWKERLERSGGVTGSLDVVVNYQSGQVSTFRSGGGFAGFNGGGSVQVSQGLIWGNLGNNNSKYSGPFTNASGSVGPLGVTVSRSSGGVRAALNFSGPFIVSVTGGVSLFGPATGTGSLITSSQPTPAGNLTSLSGLGPWHSRRLRVLPLEVSMPLKIPLVPAILLCSGVFFVVMANITFYSLLSEVNGGRDPRERIGMLFVNLRFFEVMRLHKQLFPVSKKRVATYVLSPYLSI